MADVRAGDLFRGSNARAPESPVAWVVLRRAGNTGRIESERGARVERQSVSRFEREHRAPVVLSAVKRRCRGLVEKRAAPWACSRATSLPPRESVELQSR